MRHFPMVKHCFLLWCWKRCIVLFLVVRRICTAEQQLDSNEFFFSFLLFFLSSRLEFHTCLFQKLNVSFHFMFASILVLILLIAICFAFHFFLSYFFFSISSINIFFHLIFVFDLILILILLIVIFFLFFS